MKKVINTVKTNCEEPYLVYGLSYKTIHDDSSYYDDHEKWFDVDEELRDKVFGDWGNDLYWDNIKNEELEHRTPRPNYNHSLTKKISKFCTGGTKEVITYKLSEDEYKEILKELESRNVAKLLSIFKKVI